MFTRLLKRASKQRRVDTQFRNYVDEHTRDLKNLLYKLFQEQAEWLIKGLKRSKKTVNLLDLSKAKTQTINISFKGLFDGLDKAAMQEIMDAVGPEIIESYKAGATRGLSKIRIKQQVTPEKIAIAGKEDARNRAAGLVGMRYNGQGKLVKGSDEYSLLKTTRKLLERDIEASYEAGESAEELAKTIRSNYAFSQARSETIARTELSNAYIRGNLSAWRMSGVVTSKKWITAPECCDLCEELDGVVVDLDEEFPNDAGQGPTLHPNCRCDLSPVTDYGKSDQTDLLQLAKAGRERNPHHKPKGSSEGGQFASNFAWVNELEDDEKIMDRETKSRANYKNLYKATPSNSRGTKNYILSLYRSSTKLVEDTQKHLRGIKVTKQSAKDVDAVKKQISAKLPKNMYLFRGMSLKNVSFQSGQIFNHKSFLSLSTDSDIARGFASGSSKNTYKVFRVKVPKGTNYALPGNSSDGEREVLINPGKIRVTGVKQRKM